MTLHGGRLASIAILSLCFLMALSGSAAAQNSSVSGVVKDPQQAVVPGAEVVLRNSRSVATPTRRHRRRGPLHIHGAAARHLRRPGVSQRIRGPIEPGDCARR